MNLISKGPLALMLLCGTVYGAQSADASNPSKAPSPHAVKTNMPGIYAYTQPPADFNARTASQQELASWGYPPRPAASEGATALARWLDEVNPAMQRVVPDLVRREGIYHRPAEDLKVAATGARNAPITATSGNWSGMAILPVEGGQPFYSVSGRWTVPTVKQAPGSCSGGWDYSSQWVGLGGFNDQFLFQAGSAANVFCDIGNNLPEYFPWIEWLPESEIVIYKNAATETLYPFAAGDYLIVTVWAPAASWSGGVSTTGNLSFQDVTQGWTFSLATTAAALGGSEVTGQSAEWIVERTEVNGELATLPDYVSNPWYLTKATDLGAVIHYPGAPGTSTAYNVTMLDNSDLPYSFVDLFGKDALWFFPEGSAVQ
jgi:hypothetical protein